MKKDTYSVEVVGFGQTERMALTSVFELSSRRVPKFVRHAAPDTLPDIFLVDADDAEAIKQLGERNSGGHIPAILIGESNRGTAWTVLPRPIRWMKLFQAFDVAVGTSPAGTQATPPAAPAVASTAPASAAVAPATTAAAATAPSAVAPAVQVQAAAPKSSADWVLVVDDNQTVREFMKSKLAAFNFNVDYAESGEQAIGFTGQKNYACIFLDVVMPGIDGYQVCKLIKSNRSAQKTAVVMLTSKDSPFDKIRGSMSGCNAYLTKPVDEEKLLETISRFLPQK
ncbi:MAG: response regulator [Nitrosomonadales bacterium]|nr:response regulator [Nitrosomonadales bacterium]